MNRLGVIVFNLGGPENLDQVRPFLYRLFSDPEIIRIRSDLLRSAVAFCIAGLRARKSRSYYQRIGGGSPLRRITHEQADALAAELRRRGVDVEVFVGMCTWHPFFSETLEEVEQSGVDRLVVLPLFPQYSVTTTGSGFRSLEQAIAARPAVRDLETHWIRSWQDHPTYIEAFAGLIRRELGEFTGAGEVQILFSAHSIPESYVRSGDPYLDQTRETVELIAEQLGRSHPYQLAFQSRIGPVKWLGPSTSDTLVRLGRQGVERVLVVPVSFVSEHIETLYELDIQYKKVASDSGIAEYRRVPALNSDPIFIRALAELIERSRDSAR
jgi:ferrochelatase